MTSVGNQHKRDTLLPGRSRSRLVLRRSPGIPSSDIIANQIHSGYMLSTRAPRYGEHNDEILTSMLGTAPEELPKLRQQGVIV